MTRINVTDPKHLTDQHLMAEYRELPMVHASLRRSLKSKSVEQVKAKIPASYTLNKGHVMFFYDKLMFLSRRYLALIDELKFRGYNLDPDRILNEEGLPKEFMNDWQPNDVDMEVLRPRLHLRLNQKLDFHTWFKDSVYPDFYKMAKVWQS
jgi:deoxyribonuclease (pyrimidine dimer)